MRDERLCRDGIGSWSSEGLERIYRVLSVGRIAGPAGGNRRDRGAVHLLGQEGSGWCDAQDQQTAKFVGCHTGDPIKLARNVACLRHRVHDHAAKCLRSVPVCFELKGGNGSEIAAATAQCPEHVGVLRLVGMATLAIRGDKHRRDPRTRCAGNDQPQRLRFMIDIAPGGAALNARDSSIGVDPHPAPQTHVDRQPAVAERRASYIVTASSDRWRQSVLAREVHAGDYVRRPAYPGDKRRLFSDHAVPDRARFAVSGIGGLQEGATKHIPKVGYCGLAEFVLGPLSESMGHGIPISTR